MKLKQITQLLFTLFLVVFLNSCNNDDTEYTTNAASADAQVYSFALSAIPMTSIDTVNYPILAKTKFAIDQKSRLIYNPDSLPFRTRLTKFHVSISFASSSSPSKLELIYPNDSVVGWNGTDSVDFAVKSLYPRLKVTAANGTTTKEYTIDIRIHKIDPDSIVWTKMSSQPSTVGRQKTILRGENTFYTFSIKNGVLSLYTADKSSLAWSSQAITGISASTIVLESITLFNDKFFAVDNTKKAYISSDGKDWSLQNSNIYNIVGILPSKTVLQDSLLVITENAGIYSFAKTADLRNPRIVKELSNNSSVVSNDFLAQGFSSVTNYDRDNLNKNILAITGGKDFAGIQQNKTWSIRNDGNVIEAIPNQKNYNFEAKPGIATFMYNGYLYALTQNLFFKTDSWGYKWINASTTKENYPGTTLTSGQSIIIDKDNYIWIFGGVSENGTPMLDVWKGRLNKLNPKK